MIRPLALAALLAAACGQPAQPPASPSPAPGSRRASPTVFAAQPVLTRPAHALGPACEATFECCRQTVLRARSAVPLDCQKLVSFGEPTCQSFLAHFASQDAKLKRVLPAACVPEGVQP